MVCRLRWACALRVVVWALVTGSASGAAADSINLLWDPTSGLVGYMVHVRTESGWDTQHFDAGSATEFTFPSAIAGQRYCFAVSAYLLTSALEGPNSAEVCGYSDAPPTLDEPGNPFSTVNQPTSLQLAGLDPDGRPLTYGATGLPPGLSVMASTGLISGMVTDLGTYTVTAWASDGVLSASQVFSWTITATPVPDTKPPTVSITGPTSASIYATSEPWLPLSGKSADDRGVTQVTWVNDRGGNGVATGTTSWSVPAIALQSGNNYITVLARDADGNQSTDLLAVTYTGSTPAGSTPPGSTPSLDSTSPSVWITAPTSASTLATTSSTIGVGGTASDDVGVTVIWWATDRGYSGTASGTANWNVPDLPLVSGNNAITVTAVDAAGHQSSDLLFVTYTVPIDSPPASSPSDTTAPSVWITAPTSASTLATTSSTIGVGGTASDDVGVTVIWWATDRGYSGVASGTANWNVPDLPLVSGNNAITITAVDAAGHQTSDLLFVTYTVPIDSPPASSPSDTTAPSVRITAPTSGSVLATTSSTIDVGGTASDDVGVTVIWWATDRGYSGVAWGTANWSVPDLPLVSGNNAITITAVDAAGHQSSDLLFVTYTEP